jgi:hypothetical protein
MGEASPLLLSSPSRLMAVVGIGGRTPCSRKEVRAVRAGGRDGGTGVLQMSPEGSVSRGYGDWGGRAERQDRDNILVVLAVYRFTPTREATARRAASSVRAGLDWPTLQTRRMVVAENVRLVLGKPSAQSRVPATLCHQRDSHLSQNEPPHPQAACSSALRTKHVLVTTVAVAPISLIFLVSYQPCVVRIAISTIGGSATWIAELGQVRL